jgi:polyphosphate kinase 2 (PPK2 family)
MIHDGRKKIQCANELTKERSEKRWLLKRRPSETEAIVTDGDASDNQMAAFCHASREPLERTHIPEAPWWVVQAVDKKRARLNCIHHLLQQFPYEEVTHQPVILPERERHDSYQRNTVSPDMVVPEIY